MARKFQKRNTKKTATAKSNTISYRLKCERTANGLSHFVMYGDVNKKQALV